MHFFGDKPVTALHCAALQIGVMALLFASSGQGQSADSLQKVRRVYIGSLGSYQGSQDLRQELARYLNKTGQFTAVTAVDQADAILDGKGEMWVRGYHSLSPRARANPAAAEPLHGGYLSIKVHGRNDEILWSYFADPRRVSFRELKRDLVVEVVDRLIQDRDLETAVAPAGQNAGDSPAALRAAGATFPFPIYQDWFKSFHARHPAWTFEYSPVGSEAGVAQLAARSIDFAGTDIPPDALKDRILQSAHFFPTVGGAVVLVYNVPGFSSELRLTPELIAGIFSGALRKWNAPALAAANPSVSLPDAPISTFHRADGSGTTFVFTEYLSKVNAAWKSGAGAGATVRWANGAGVNGNEGVAESVASTPGSIGYVEFIYAFEHHLNIASVRNPSGRFVQPDLLSIMAAANAAGTRQEQGLSTSASSEISAYPISAFSWLVVPSGLEPAKAAAITAFLEWMLTSGQRQCSALGYAPLPRDLADRELSALRKLR